MTLLDLRVSDRLTCSFIWHERIALGLPLPLDSLEFAHCASDLLQ